jgi:hypothetical protein
LTLSTLIKCVFHLGAESGSNRHVNLSHAGELRSNSDHSGFELQHTFWAKRLFKISGLPRKGTNDLPPRENSPNLAFNACPNAHLDAAQSRKTPRKGSFGAQSENNSLWCRLSGGECSLLRTRLWQEFPLTGKFTGEFWPLSSSDRAYLLVDTAVSGF